MAGAEACTSVMETKATRRPSSPACADICGPASRPALRMTELLISTRLGLMSDLDLRGVGAP
ncbi:hypothetical protein PVAP13_3KG553700 [Panicum virgatum]|uniref:Uncharacterized protein n=1 Tax=Panicum virgatum TaxID=38727 RepID=A0A8T0VGI2_PANVG|nr:hypothetical protein PVAP13_3KG553700 [Panicum virgatum]